MASDFENALSRSQSFLKKYYARKNEVQRGRFVDSHTIRVEPSSSSSSSSSSPPPPPISAAIANVDNEGGGQNDDVAVSGKYATAKRDRESGRQTDNGDIGDLIC